MAKRQEKVTDAPWEMINVPLVKLHLDLANYRHVEVDTEEEAIGQLYHHEKVEALAQDIAEQGSISPLDLIGVIPMDGNPDHFVAVEGNRRLCALLLLNDPDRAPTPKVRNLMKELSKKTALPDSISVVRFDSKRSAKHWIDLRHLGPQDGQGLRSWNPTQKERAADEGGPNKLALSVLDRAREGKWLGDERLPAVTTITRYLKNREVRAALGLGHHKDMVFTHDEQEVDAALQQFLCDALPTSDGSVPKVHSRTKDKDRATYARGLRALGIAPTTLLPAPVTPPPAKPAPRKPGKPRNKPDPAKRNCIVPPGFVCNASDRNLLLLFKEMQRTLIDEHEFASGYLLRAFVERVMTRYLSKVDPSFHPADDQALTRRCAEKLDPTGKAAKFKAIRTAASNKDASHSLHTLGAAVHATLLKDKRALIYVWENWEHAVTVMLTEIRNP